MAATLADFIDGLSKSVMKLDRLQKSFADLQKGMSIAPSKKLERLKVAAQVEDWKELPRAKPQDMGKAIKKGLGEILTEINAKNVAIGGGGVGANDKKTPWWNSKSILAGLGGMFKSLGQFAMKGGKAVVNVVDKLVSLVNLEPIFETLGMILEPLNLMIEVIGGAMMEPVAVAIGNAIDKLFTEENVAVLEGVGYALGNILAPIIETIYDLLARLVSSGAAQKFIDMLDGLAAQMPAILRAFEPLVPVLGTVVQAIVDFMMWLVQNGPSIIAAISGLMGQLGLTQQGFAGTPGVNQEPTIFGIPNPYYGKPQGWELPPGAHWDGNQWVGLATGGIVTQPTFAMIGESGPEAVIPLDEGGEYGSITINTPMVVGPDTVELLVRQMEKRGMGVRRR